MVHQSGSEKSWLQVERSRIYSRYFCVNDFLRHAECSRCSHTLCWNLSDLCSLCSLLRPAVLALLSICTIFLQLYKFNLVKVKHVNVMLSRCTVIFSIGDNSSVCFVYLLQMEVYICSSYLFVSLYKLSYGKVNNVCVLLRTLTVVYSNGDDRISYAVFLLQHKVYTYSSNLHLLVNVSLNCQANHVRLLFYAFIVLCSSGDCMVVCTIYLLWHEACVCSIHLHMLFYAS